MPAAKTPRKRPPVNRGRQAPARIDARVRLEDPARIVQRGIIKWVAWGVGALVAAGAAWTAWTSLGLPRIATYEYVDGHIREVVRPIAIKVDNQGVYILSGRIETLKGNRQQQLDAKARLDLQSHTITDPVAVQIIQGQQRSIDGVVKDIDEQIADLTAQLKTVQDGNKH